MNSNPWTPTEEFLRSIDVHLLLPQQEPYVMIDSLVEFNKIITTTEATIADDSIFTDNDHFSVSGIIENIAQTCAARIGYINKYILGRDLQLGFIAAVRDMSVTSSARVGDVITTRVELIEEVFGMTLAKAVVTCGCNILVQTQIKMAMAEGGNRFL